VNAEFNLKGKPTENFRAEMGKPLLRRIGQERVLDPNVRRQRSGPGEFQVRLVSDRGEIRLTGAGHWMRLSIPSGGTRGFGLAGMRGEAGKGPNWMGGQLTSERGRQRGHGDFVVLSRPQPIPDLGNRSANAHPKPKPDFRIPIIAVRDGTEKGPPARTRFGTHSTDDLSHGRLWAGLASIMDCSPRHARCRRMRWNGRRGHVDLLAESIAPDVTLSEGGSGAWPQLTGFA